MHLPRFWGAESGLEGQPQGGSAPEAAERIQGAPLLSKGSHKGCPYSVFKASQGLTRAARWAGTRFARAATPKSRPVAPIQAMGSTGLIP